MSENKWEAVEENTDRLSVPGGWLYRVATGLYKAQVVFVPTSKQSISWQQFKNNKIKELGLKT